MNTTQPSIEQLVAMDMAVRSRKGVKKYGFTVAENPLPLKAWLQHAYEESLDLPIYLKRAIVEMEGNESANALPGALRTMQTVAEWLERTHLIEADQRVTRNMDLARELRMAMAEAGEINAEAQRTQRNAEEKA